MTDAEFKSLVEKTVDTLRQGAIGKNHADHLLAVISWDGAIAPLPFPDASTDRRHRFLYAMGQALAPIYPRMSAVLHSGEVWYASGKSLPNETPEQTMERENQIPPSQRKDRKEAITISILTKDGRTFGAMLDIKRADGKIASLPDLAPFTSFNNTEVRMYILEALLDGMAGKPFERNPA